MNINLKQTVLIKAITSYLVSQGINVTNKNIDVTFTSGRKGTGVSADVSISDKNEIYIPGYTNAEADSPSKSNQQKVDEATAPFDTQPPQDKVEIKNSAIETAVATGHADDEPSAVPAAKPDLLAEALAETRAEEEAAAVETATPKKTKNSLFGA